MWREAEAQPEMFQQKKKDTVVLGKLFWLEHFQLGSRHFWGLPFAQLASG